MKERDLAIGVEWLELKVKIGSRLLGSEEFDLCVFPSRSTPSTFNQKILSLD